MSNVYRLQPDNLPNTDTVKCLSLLLKEARKGQLTGIAFVGYVKEFGYIANSAGAAYEDPTLTRGMLLALSDKLAARIDGGNL